MSVEKSRWRSWHAVDKVAVTSIGIGIVTLMDTGRYNVLDHLMPCAIRCLATENQL